MVKVLFVCMGNICRSPTAEGVFRHHVSRRKLEAWLEIDSAGTHSYHVGKPPDRRAMAAALQRGFDLSALRARQVAPEDFELFDYILAMDRANYEDLLMRCPAPARSKVHLFLQFGRGLAESEVPDPYYGGGKGFEHVLDLVEAASTGFLTYLVDRHGLAAGDAPDR